MQMTRIFFHDEKQRIKIRRISVKKVKLAAPNRRHQIGGSRFNDGLKLEDS